MEITSKQDVQSLLNQIDQFFLDCDGVLWRGHELIPHVAETLDMLKKMVKKIVANFFLRVKKYFILPIIHPNHANKWQKNL